MPNWRQSTKNIKVELYSEAILWKMIRGLMQYSLELGSSASQLKAAKVMDIISRCLVAQDKQQTQYLLIPRSKMEDAPKLLNIPKIGKSRHWGFVYHDTSGQNHGPVWKTQSSSWKEYVWSSSSRTVMGKAIGKSYWNMAGENSKLGMSLLFIVKKGLSYLCMWMTSNWLERNKILTLNKEVDLGEPTSFLDHVYLGWTQRQCEMSKDVCVTITEPCSNREFQREE